MKKEKTKETRRGGDTLLELGNYSEKASNDTVVMTAPPFSACFLSEGRSRGEKVLNYAGTKPCESIYLFI